MAKKKKNEPVVKKVYKAPEELLQAGSEGKLLEWSLQQCFGLKGWQTHACEYMGVVRQTVYGWAQNGLPAERQEDFEKFASDPKSGFAIAENAKVSNYIRVRAEKRNEKREPPAQKRNQALLDFLVNTIRYPYEGAKGTSADFGSHSLESLATKMRNVSSVHLFWKWAYNDGGVPVTYIEDFVRSATDLRLYMAMEFEKLHDPDVFGSYVRRRMCVDKEYHAKFYAEAAEIATAEG
jgi:hypothetical protein